MISKVVSEIMKFDKRWLIDFNLKYFKYIFWIVILIGITIQFKYENCGLGSWKYYEFYKCSLEQLGSILGAIATMLAITFAYVGIFVMMHGDYKFGIEFYQIFYILYEKDLNKYFFLFYFFPLILFVLMVLAVIFKWFFITCAVIIATLVLIFMAGSLSYIYCYYQHKGTIIEMNQKFLIKSRALEEKKNKEQCERKKLKIIDSQMKLEIYNPILNVINDAIVLADDNHFDIIEKFFVELNFKNDNKILYSTLECLKKLSSSNDENQINYYLGKILDIISIFYNGNDNKSTEDNLQMVFSIMEPFFIAVNETEIKFNQKIIEYVFKKWENLKEPLIEMIGIYLYFGINKEVNEISNAFKYLQRVPVIRFYVCENNFDEKNMDNLIDITFTYIKTWRDINIVRKEDDKINIMNLYKNNNSFEILLDRLA